MKKIVVKMVTIMLIVLALSSALAAEEFKLTADELFNVGCNLEDFMLSCGNDIKEKNPDFDISLNHVISNEEISSTLNFDYLVWTVGSINVTIYNNGLVTMEANYPNGENEYHEEQFNTYEDMLNMFNG